MPTITPIASETTNAFIENSVPLHLLDANSFVDSGFASGAGKIPDGSRQPSHAGIHSGSNRLAGSGQRLPGPIADSHKVYYGIFIPLYLSATYIKFVVNCTNKGPPNGHSTAARLPRQAVRKSRVAGADGH